VAWLPAIEIGIGDEKVIHIPERNQELAPHLIRPLIAKQQIILGLMSTVEPAHDVHPHATRRLVKLD
jgi:hypothetical protein